MKDYVSNGWQFNSPDMNAEYVKEDLYTVLDEIYNLSYEIKSCVRGAYTDCTTYEELAEYIRDLGNRLTGIADDVETVSEDSVDDVDDEDLTEAVDTKTDYIQWRNRMYPVKDKSFLDGKLASYRNEMGLEHIGILTKNGKKYDIYDSGFGNLTHTDRCAVLAESIVKPLRESVYHEPLRVWIGNLGKYVEGELEGKWIDLPVSRRDYQNALKEIGIEAGTPYEEVHIADYDDPYGYIYDFYGEYPDIYELNAIAQALSELNGPELDTIEAMVKTGVDSGKDALWEYIANVLDGNCYLIDGSGWDDLGYYLVDNVYGSVDNIPKEEIEQYFDYEALGRDLDQDSYEDDEGNTIYAGQYWCGDEDATDEEIGECYVNNVGFEGVSNPENYLDYYEFGRSFKDDGYDITSNGILDYSQFDYDLGKEYKEEYMDKANA